MGTSLTGEEILAGAEALVPEVEAAADRIAADRRLPDELVAGMRSAGVFRMPMPHARGGPEMDPIAQTEVIERLSYADASAGWVAMIGSDAGFYSAFLDDDAALAIYPDLDSVTAGWLVPAGRAQRTTEGYVVDGRWAFGSACLHADVLVGGCLVFDGDELVVRDDGRPEMRVVMAPAERWTILDTWHTTGLAGSGSNDYTATALEVPAEHTFSLLDPPRRTEPLYGFNGMFFSNMHGVPLGLARRAIDEVLAIAEHKVVMPEMIAMRDLGRVRNAVARAEMLLGAARAYTYTSLERVWARLTAGDQLTERERIDLALSRVNAFHIAREVTQLMVDTAGTQAIYATSPLDRLLRDAITMHQHIVAGDRMLEWVGGIRLGQPSPLPFV